MRTQSLAKPEVGDFLSKHFVSVYDKVGTFQLNVGPDGKTPIRNGGNVAAFFCTPGGFVIHVAAGPRTGEAFLAEAKWATTVYSRIMKENIRNLPLPPAEQVARMSAALRQAHSTAYDLLVKPNPFAPDLELVFHQPSPDPKLQRLVDAGLKQRQAVHQLLKTRAFQPLPQLGPEIYTNILGERVTEEPVQLTGAPEARQAAGAGKTLSQFFAEGGAASRPAAPPPDPAKTKSAESNNQSTSKRSRGTTRR